MLKIEKLQEINTLPGKRFQTAVVDGRARLTWANLEEQTRSLIAHFGPKEYRRVVFLSENRVEIIPMMSAFSTLGVPFVGVDYTSSYDHKRHCAREVSADCVVYSTAFREDARALHDELGIDTFCIDTDGAEVRTDAHPPNSIRPRPFESISFTSGTSGLPKAVHRNVSFDVRRFSDLKARFGFGDGEVFVATVPFFHVSVNGWARMFLSLGGKLVLTDIADPIRIYRDIVEHGVTAMLATPPVLDALVGLAVKSLSRPALRFVVVGGKAFPADLKRRALEFLGPIVNEYYGTTETGVNVMAGAEDMVAFPESSGRIMAGSDVAILDAAGRPLPEGILGRVAIDSYQNMGGYLNGRQADFVQLNDRRYFVTPDCGYLKGGRLYLASRTFGAFTSVNLYALENGLRATPGVQDVFSIALRPDAIQVFIAKGEAADGARLAEKAASLARREAGAGTDVQVRFVARIPYSMSGKVRVQDLIQLS